MDVRNWIDLARTLLDGGVRYAAVVVGDQEDDLIAVVPLVELLEAAREFASGSDEWLRGGDQPS